MVTPHDKHNHPAGHTPDMHDPPDEWHRHTTAEERPQVAHGEIGNPNAIIAAGGIAFVLVVVAALAVYLYYTAYTIEQLDAAERVGLEAEVLRERQEITDRMQRGYVWADPAKGYVQIPMDIARRRVIDQYSRRYPSPSTPQDSD